MLLANECPFTSLFFFSSRPYLGFSLRFPNSFQYIESILITLWQTEHSVSHTHARYYNTFSLLFAPDDKRQEEKSNRLIRANRFECENEIDTFEF